MRAMQERDEARLEELVAEGFRFTALHLAPEPMSREQWMGAAMGGYHIVSFAYESMDIDVFGDAAVIHARYSQIANFDAVNLSHGYRLTDVWARIDGRWCGGRAPVRTREYLPTLAGGSRSAEVRFDTYNSPAWFQ